MFAFLGGRLNNADRLGARHSSGTDWESQATSWEPTIPFHPRTWQFICIAAKQSSGETVRSFKMDDTLQRKCIRTSSLRISIKAISRPHQRYEREDSFFVPIAEQ